MKSFRDRQAAGNERAPLASWQAARLLAACTRVERSKKLPPASVLEASIKVADGGASDRIEEPIMATGGGCVVSKDMRRVT